MMKNLRNCLVSAYLKKHEEAREVMERIIRNERGAGAVEYALVIGAVVVMIVGLMLALNPQIKSFFDSVMQAVQDLIA